MPGPSGHSTSFHRVRVTKADSRRRRYRCAPKNGRIYTFTVVEADESRRLVPITETPPECPDHPV